jgi:N-acetylgalactosamine-6-sulfatase
VPKGFTSPFEVYAGSVTEMDRQIGPRVGQAGRAGLAKNTIVVFSSDNGPEDMEIGNASVVGLGSAGPLRGRKRSLYDGGTRVPFIVRWPQGGAPAGQVNAQTVVSGADLLPRCASWPAWRCPTTCAPRCGDRVWRRPFAATRSSGGARR